MQAWEEDRDIRNFAGLVGETISSILSTLNKILPQKKNSYLNFQRFLIHTFFTTKLNTNLKVIMIEEFDYNLLYGGSHTFDLRRRWDFTPVMQVYLTWGTLTWALALSCSLLFSRLILLDISQQRSLTAIGWEESLLSLMDFHWKLYIIVTEKNLRSTPGQVEHNA